MIKIVNLSILIVLIFIACFLLLRFFADFRNINLKEPVFKTYNSDEMIYLKTFYLLKKGETYYKALRQANESDIRQKAMSTDVFTWRWPTVFYIWKFTANNGKEILRNFWFLVIASLVSGYFILKKFLGYKLAILGSLLLIPYFADNLVYQTSFLFTEWWAWFFLIFSLTFFIYDRIILAWIFLFLTVITRELMIIPTIVFFILSLIFGKNRFTFLLIIGLFVLFFSLHSKAIFNQQSLVKISSNSNLVFSRIHNFDKNSFLGMISFSMRQYPLVKYKGHLILFFLAFLSLVFNFFKKNTNQKIFYLMTAGWSLVLTLPFINSSQYNDYWGILFMPTLILTIPLIFY